jgi:hypothetical protein
VNIRGNNIGAIREVLGRLLLYHKEYECAVIDDRDAENRGRVQVAIPEIGMDTKANGIWAAPEYSHDQATPIVGSYALIRFLGGSISRAVYRGRSGRIKANVPKAYKEPNTVVLFEDDGEDPLTITLLRKERVIEIVKGKEWRFRLDLENQTRKETIGDVWSNETDYKNKKSDIVMGKFEFHINDTELLLKSGNLKIHIHNDKMFIGNSSKGLTEILTTFMSTVKTMKLVGSPAQHVVSVDDMAKIEQSIADTKSLLGDS